MRSVLLCLLLALAVLTPTRAWASHPSAAHEVVAVATGAPTTSLDPLFTWVPNGNDFDLRLHTTNFLNNFTDVGTTQNSMVTWVPAWAQAMLDSTAASFPARNLRVAIWAGSVGGEAGAIWAGGIVMDAEYSFDGGISWTQVRDATIVATFTTGTDAAAWVIDTANAKHDFSAALLVELGDTPPALGDATVLAQPTPGRPRVYVPGPRFNPPGQEGVSWDQWPFGPDFAVLIVQLSADCPQVVCDPQDPCWRPWLKRVGWVDWGLRRLRVASSTFSTYTQVNPPEGVLGDCRCAIATYQIESVTGRWGFERVEATLNIQRRECICCMPV